MDDTQYIDDAGRYRVFGHNPNYGRSENIYPTESVIKAMFGWQKDAFEMGKDERFFLTQAFCGSGKSILQINLAIHDIVSSGYRQKQLFVVPQEHIHKGFVGDGLDLFMRVQQGGVEYNWAIQPHHNFCHGISRIENLKKWLLTPPEKLAKGFTGQVIGGLNAVCSHAALAQAWKEIKAEYGNEGLNKIIRNLTLRVDEAHHISLVFMEGEDLTYDEWKAIKSEITALGDICTYIVNSRVRSCKLHLTTATMYRGDSRIVLSLEVRAKFKPYYLDWIKHFESLNIREFLLQYEFYEENPIDLMVARILAEPNEKHFVVVPRSGSKWRSEGNEHEAIFDKLNGSGLRVLDLVTKTTQKKNKKLLLDEPKSFNPDTPSNFDVVVVCNLGREGTDWCPCSRLHNSSCEASITLAVQTVGRPFRRYQGKETVNIYHYVKKFVMPKKGITLKELLGDRTTAILYCMQIEDLTNPILIIDDSFELPDQNPNPKDTENTEGIEPTTALVPFQNYFGDQYENVIRAALQGYEKLTQEFEDRPKSKDVYNLMGQICDEFGIDKDHESRDNIQWALTSRFIRMASPQAKLDGVDVEFLRQAGFNEIDVKYELDRSIYFKNCSKEIWLTIRTIIHGEWQEKFDQVKAIGLENIIKLQTHPLFWFVKHQLYIHGNKRQIHGKQ